MTESITIEVITTVGLIVVAWLGNRKLNRIGKDAKVTRHQTENSHQGAEYPNLRDEITAVHADVRAITGTLKGHGRRFDHIESNLADLHTEDDLIGTTIDRKGLAAARALTALREEIPDLIKVEISQHVQACPLRQKHDK